MKLNLTAILRYAVPALVALLSTYAKRAVAATRSLGRFAPALAGAALLTLTSCVSIDPLPGFHYDSRIEVEAPATIDAEANLRADVVQLACYALDLVGFADDVPVCALYAPVPEPSPEPAPVPVEPVEPVAFTPAVLSAAALGAIAVPVGAEQSIFVLLLGFIRNVRSRIQAGRLNGIDETLADAENFISIAASLSQGLPPEPEPAPDRDDRDRDDD